MAIEEGIVIAQKAGSNLALVKTVRSSACEACAARHSCNVDRNSQEMEVTAVNLAGALPGDRVCIQVATRSLLKVTFMTYLFPIICMLIGALAGNKWALATSAGNESAMAVLGAVLAFVVSFFLLRIAAQKMEKDSRYQPKIIRIIRKAPAMPPESGPPPGGQPQNRGRVS